MTAVRSHSLQRQASDGSRLALRWLECAGDGPTVLFQHGLGGNAEQTLEVFPSVAAPATAMPRLLTLECRGHGQSDCGPYADLSIATFADDVGALLRHATSAPAFLGGISMGAAIALRLAVLHPERVRGLILVRPAWTWQAAPANMAPNLEVGRLLADLPAEQACAVFRTGATAAHLAREAPDNLASLLGFFQRAPQAATAQLLCRISGDGPGITREQAAQLRVPALVLGCAQDFIHPLSLARALADTLPAARFAEVTPKGTDRAAYVHDVSSAIRTFIAEVHAA